MTSEELEHQAAIEVENEKLKKENALIKKAFALACEDSKYYTLLSIAQVMKIYTDMVEEEE